MSNSMSETSKHKYCNKTLEMEKGARMLYLMLGERLYNIRHQRLYEPFWSSWGEYCMEFKDLSPASISKVIAVYELFVLKLGFTTEELADSGGWTKLYQISRFVKDKEDAIKWLATAKDQTRQDLEKHLIEAKTGVDMTECSHENTYMIRVCADCGDKERVF